MNNFWKYLEYIVWPIGIAILGAGAYLIYKSPDNLNKLIWIISTLVLFFGNWIGLPKLIQYLKLKSDLNHFAKETFSNFYKISDCQNILPYSSIKVDGFADKSDFSYIRGEAKHIFIINEESYVMKQKILLASTESCLPKITKEGLLDATALRSLSLLMSLDFIQESKVKYESENYILAEINKNIKLKEWLDKWKKINESHNYFGTEKNLLYQFLCPKLENIAGSIKTKRDKADEINFLIESMTNYKLIVIFLFYSTKTDEKFEAAKKVGLTLNKFIAQQINDMLKNYPYFVLAARGSYIKSMLTVTKHLNEINKNIKQVYDKEDDIWIFPHGLKRGVSWLIFKNESFK